MLTEFYTRSGKTKLVQHSKLPFVYNFGNKQVCVEHLNGKGMNKGAMRQHVEGKAHRRNYDTGESITHSEIPKEILAQLELQKKESKNEPKQDNFDELNRKLKIMFPDNPEDIKEILAKYGFDGMIKYEIQDRMTGNKRDQMSENYAKFMVHYMKQNPSKCLELFQSYWSNSAKKAESRHELPSKAPGALPKPSKSLLLPK